MVKKEEFEQAIDGLKKEIACLKSVMIEMKNDVIDVLKTENADLKNQVNELMTKVEQQDVLMNKIDQYSRRNNLVIDGIPSSVTNQALESKVVDIMSKVDIKFSQSDIESCHRLGKSSKTILRFVNRKSCSMIISKKKELSNLNHDSLQQLGFSNQTKLYVRPNLTPFDEKIAYYCRELKRNKLIGKTWFYSGSNFIKNENTPENESTEINHLKHLVRLFSTFNFKFPQDIIM